MESANENLTRFRCLKIRRLANAIKNQRDQKKDLRHIDGGYANEEIIYVA